MRLHQVDRAQHECGDADIRCLKRLAKAGNTPSFDTWGRKGCVRFQARAGAQGDVLDASSVGSVTPPQTNNYLSVDHEQQRLQRIG